MRDLVDWYPWGDEALEVARVHDRPILLSIGFFSCRVCLSMQRESFLDPATAALMNAHFVCINVDREERPDLDQTYQWAAQLSRRSGGWPLLAFLTPDLRPFYGVTYLPREASRERPAFSDVLKRLARAFEHERDEVEAGASAMAEAIVSITRGIADDSTAEESTAAGPLSLGCATAHESSRLVADEILGRAARLIAHTVDREHGGLGTRPKFPNPMPLKVLLRAGIALGRTDWVRDAEEAGRAMRCGGIFDQLDGGFHRYAVDAAWAMPQFEKLLVDQALLVDFYLDLFVATGNGEHRETAELALGYVERILTDPDGGFYTSQSGEGPEETGAYYLFEVEELLSVLGPDDATVAAAVFGVTEAGNYRDGKSVLRRVRDIAAMTSRLGYTRDEIGDAIGRAEVKLRALRESRTKPPVDEKRVTAYNALMISAFARAASVLAEPRYLRLAEDALGRIASECWDGRVLKRIAWRGAVSGEAFVDDYALLGLAALDVVAAGGSARFGQLGEALAAAMVEGFWDDDRAHLAYRKLYQRGNVDGVSSAGWPLGDSEMTDHAIPSGGAASVQLLDRVACSLDAWATTPAVMSRDEEGTRRALRYRSIADALEARFLDRALHMPQGHGRWIQAIESRRRAHKET